MIDYQRYNGNQNSDQEVKLKINLGKTAHERWCKP
jgi:hypothetical protein